MILLPERFQEAPKAILQELEFYSLMPGVECA